MIKLIETKNYYDTIKYKGYVIKCYRTYIDNLVSGV